MTRSTIQSCGVQSSDHAYPLKLKQLNQPLNMWLHDQRDQHVSKDIADKGVWEIYETQLILERLKPGINFVDVGANIGYYTLIAADQVGSSGFVAAFEPDPENFLLLEKNLAENNFNFVEAVNAGLSDADRDGSLFLSDSNFGDHQIYDAGDGRDSRSIQLLNGAEYLQEKIKTIDLLKIDTQGAESQVMSGLLPLLQRSGKTLTIIIEFWPYGLRQSGSSAHQLVDMLMTLQLPLRIIDHVGHQLLDCSEQQLREWVDMVDAVPDDQGFMNIMLGD
ncbi:MAG TPA: FkbM family methyltransferase [Porticoccus sp.]|nr:FkbM family methyltransferase [Porticoccus sp.]